MNPLRHRSLAGKGWVLSLIAGTATLLLLAALSMSGSAAHPARAGAAPQSGQWQVVSSPNVGSGANVLAGVAANAATDVVAVGSYVDAAAHQHTLVEHWDGSAWAVVASPDPDPTLSGLHAVAVDHAGGYWAAGVSYSSTYGALIEHQSGPGAPWTLATVPTFSGAPNLTGISAAAPNDAWAVGSLTGAGYPQTLVLHWDGSAWSQVPSPNPSAGNNFLNGVVAVDADNIWAVGDFTTAGGYTFTPFTLHCDHTLNCSVVPFPLAGTTAQLKAISGRPAVGGGVELWASGFDADSTALHALIGYGDGQGWSLNAPAQAYVENGIYVPAGSVPGLGGRPIVAVGDDETPGHSPIGPSAVTSDTTGSGWTVAPPVVVGTGQSLFYAVGGAPGADVWAVGVATGGAAGGHAPHTSIDQTLTEHFILTGPPPTATPTCADPAAEPSPPPQLTQTFDPHLHSTLVAYDPDPRNTGHALELRDTDFAAAMANLLTANGTPRVRDAAFLFQECFGGQMLVALEQALGPAGVKWVGGSASTYSQIALGYENGEGTGYGFWTQALLRGPLTSGPLIGALQYARRHDPVANQETGQYITDNGGEAIRLPDACATSHHAILWGGLAIPGDPIPLMSIYNNIAAMRAALVNAWGEPNGFTITIDVLFGDGQHKPDGTDLPAEWNAHPGTLDQLATTVAHLAPQLNTSEQFLFYASDHGGFFQDYCCFPVDRPAAGATPVPLPPGGTRQDSFTLTQESVRSLLADPSGAPAVVISYTGSLDSNTAVSVAFNGQVVGYLQQGVQQVTLPVTPSLVLTGNQVVLQSANSTTIEINQGTFDSRAVAEVPPPVCTTSYSDVPAGSAFYPYVECLACGGLISGYGDGTFHPGATVTRGQAAKFLANAAKYADVVPPAQQTFEDVPPGSPFWQYVEEVAMHGAISGYTCGQGPAGPCVPPANRPYFVPQANMTRGQLAKVASATAGFTDSIPPTQQTFADVPGTAPFWLYVERVALHGVISGYGCGVAPAGPCDGQHRPYFLPGATVTRGQTAKIVSKSFFPDCQAP